MKHPILYEADERQLMPPTRGHDLKLESIEDYGQLLRCPPHGGTT